MDLIYVELSCPAVYLNRHSGFGNLACVPVTYDAVPSCSNGNGLSLKHKQIAAPCHLLVLTGVD